MELRGRRNNQLHWVRYQAVQTMMSTGAEVKADVDVTNGQTFPPLYFSRVKSYTTEAENAL